MAEAHTGELVDCLLTQVLAHIAGCDARRILCRGGPGRRAVRRRRFPRVSFYGSPLQNLKGGFLAHRHPQPEIALVLQGRLYIGLDAQVYRASAGDWCLFPPDAPHGECCAGGGYRLLWFVPGADRLRLHVTSYARPEGYRVTGQAQLRDVSGEQIRRVGELCAHGGDADPGFRAGLLRLADWCVAQLQSQAAQPGETPHPRVLRARRLLDERPADPPSVGELAARVGLSPNYLSSLFRRQCGMTIRRYVEERRVAAACALLRQSDLPLKEIAYTLGFSDPHHFSHLFRRVLGTSPSAYRGQAVEIQTPDR